VAGRRTGDIWPEVLSKSISGWIVGLAIPASLALFSGLMYLAVSEYHVQTTYAAIEKAVAEHDQRLDKIEDRLMPAGMVDRLDKFLSEQEQKKQPKP